MLNFKISTLSYLQYIYLGAIIPVKWVGLSICGEWFQSVKCQKSRLPNKKIVHENNTGVLVLENLKKKT